MTERNRVRQNCQESPSAESQSSQWTPWSVVYIWKIRGATSPLHHLVKITRYTTSKPEKMQNPQSISCTHSLGYLLPNLSENVSISSSAPHLFDMAPTSMQLVDLPASIQKQEHLPEKRLWETQLEQAPPSLIKGLCGLKQGRRQKEALFYLYPACGNPYINPSTLITHQWGKAEFRGTLECTEFGSSSLGTELLHKMFTKNAQTRFWGAPDMSVATFS